MLIREARPEDNEALQQAMVQCTQGKSLRFTLLNTPDFFARARAYEQHKVFAVEHEGTLVSSIACAVRTVLINGERLPVGYEFQLFTLPSYRRQGLSRQMREHVEAYLHEQGAVASSAFVVPDNRPSCRLFEAAGFSMHRQLSAAIILSYKHMPLDSRYSISPAREADLEAVAWLMNQNWSASNFYMPMSAEGLTSYIGRTPALELAQLLLLKDRTQILACAAIWDWSQIIQIRAEALNPSLHIVRKSLDLIRLIRPMPRLPATGELFKQWGLALLAFKQPEHLGLLLREVNNRAVQAGIEQIVVATCERNHALFQSMKGFMSISSPVKFYVKILESQLQIDQRPVYADVLDF